MCAFPAIGTLPSANVRLRRLDGGPVRGTRSLADGSLSLCGLTGIAPDTPLLKVTLGNGQVEAQIVRMAPLSDGGG